MKLSPVKAQVSLELSIALISVLILLLGSLNVFVWVNQRLVWRQRDYEDTRVKAGSTTLDSTLEEIQVDESAYPKLDAFKGRD